MGVCDGIALRGAYGELLKLDYTGELYREFRDSETVGVDEPVPILCVAVHNGATTRRGLTRTGDIVRLPPSLG